MWRMFLIIRKIKINLHKCGTVNEDYSLNCVLLMYSRGSRNFESLGLSDGDYWHGISGDGKRYDGIMTPLIKCSKHLYFSTPSSLVIRSAGIKEEGDIPCLVSRII